MHCLFWSYLFNLRTKPFKRGEYCHGTDLLYTIPYYFIPSYTILYYFQLLTSPLLAP